VNVERAARSDPSEGELAFVVRGHASRDAITESLRTLLRTRHIPIGRHRFTVLDTFDSRIHRAGARLTRADVNGTATVTWRPHGGSAALAVPSFAPFGFAWDLPDGPLQEALTPVIGVRRLLAQAEVEQHGSLLEILDDRRKTVARLRIESGRARLPVSRSTWHALPVSVTLTALRGFGGVYQEIVPVIESRPGIARCAEGLHQMILQHAGAPEAQGLRSRRADLAPTVRADVGARQIHRALVNELIANEPGLRENLDSEFLHDFRVALRRTRSLIGQLKFVFPPDIVEHFSAEMSWLGRLTGPPRDLDVLVLAIRAHQIDCPVADKEALLACLSQAHERGRRVLLEALDSARYKRLLADWQMFLDRPATTDLVARNARQPLVDVVSSRAWKLSRRIARGAERIDEHTAVEELHRIRIDAKKLRYLVDATPAFYDAADLQCILGALKKLQRVLGDFNDAQVQQTLLLRCGHDLGDAGGPVSAVLAIGQLAEQRRQSGERLRWEVADQLHRFGAHATRSACRRAFKRESNTEQAR
jgi:CHAD domain-containing protein